MLFSPFNFPSCSTHGKTFITSQFFLLNTVECQLSENRLSKPFNQASECRTCCQPEWYKLKHWQLRRKGAASTKGIAREFCMWGSCMMPRAAMPIAVTQSAAGVVVAVLCPDYTPFSQLCYRFQTLKRKQLK